MNSDYFTPNIIAPLEQHIFPAGRRPQAKRLTLHLDNCSIYMAEATEVDINSHNVI
jgi:hypothetical protein